MADGVERHALFETTKLKMRVLVACEFSGIVRDAFAAKGHDAWSCDLLPTERTGNHIQGDVLAILNDGWDMMIAHPPCTYLSNSGVRWLYEHEEINGKKIGSPYLYRGGDRFKKMCEAAEFFMRLLSSKIPLVCVENPTQHKHAKLPKWTQTIQPWQFGTTETKRTCLWLQGLPPLVETKNVYEEMMKLPYGQRAKVHFMSPGELREKNRSRTYEGIAQAMADQWG